MVARYGMREMAWTTIPRSSEGLRDLEIRATWWRKKSTLDAGQHCLWIARWIPRIHPCAEACRVMLALMFRLSGRAE